MPRLVLGLCVLLLGQSALAADVWDLPFTGVRHLHRTGPSNLNLHAVVVDLCAPGVSIRTTAYAERAQRTSTFASAVGAQLAINADFSCRPIDTGSNSPFPPCVGHVPYVTYGMAMHDGVTWPGTLGLDALIAFGVDRAQLYDNAEQQPFESWMREGTGGHFSSVIDGAANGYDCPIDPRTAIGLSKDRTKLILVVADGRSTWRGITCREAADLMVELGADRGTGLDSGGSSTMWFEGQGVLNHPSDGTERVVGNHLAVFATGSGPPSHCALPPTLINPSAPLPSVSALGPPGRFNGLTPVRMFDTRAAPSSSTLLGLVRDATGRVAAASPFEVEVAGAFGVPSSASGVALGLTAVDATAAGYASVWPSPLALPNISTVNFTAGSATANSALVGLGTPGRISISASAAAHLVSDLQGYFAPTGAGFVPSDAHRLLDTRADAAGALKAQVSRVIVPASSPAPHALALNLTATGSQAAGFVTVYPCDQPAPGTSSLNFAAGQTIGAAVLARSGATGICAEASVDVDLVVDGAGTFEAEGGLAFQAVAPVRLVDTRDPTSAWVGRTTRQTPLPLNLGGLQGLPAQTQAVALNVTVTDAIDDGFATLFPCAAGLPGTSNVNFRAGQTISNSVLVGLGDGKLCLQSTGRTHVVVDLTGVFVVGPATAEPDAGAVPPAGDSGVPPDPDAGTGDQPAKTAAPGTGGCGCHGAPVNLAGALAALLGLARTRIRRRQP